MSSNIGGFFGQNPANIAVDYPKKLTLIRRLRAAGEVS